MHAGVRRVFGRLGVALLVMSGMALLMVRAAFEMVAPTGTAFASSGSSTEPPVDSSSYSAAFVKDVLYGVPAGWDASKVSSARDLGIALRNEVGDGYPAAKALLSDQIAYMDWLLACHDTLGGAMGQVEGGLFGQEASSLAAAIESCRAQALAWVEAAVADAEQYKGYGFASVPGYGTWDNGAYAELGLLDLASAPALDALVPYASLFHGTPPAGFGSPGQVEAYLGQKEIRAPLTSAASTAHAVAAHAIDGASAVAVWIRQALQQGAADAQVQVRVDGAAINLCGVALGDTYCPTGMGDLVQSVNASAVPGGPDAVSVFGAGKPGDDQVWGLMMRNGAGSDLTGLSMHAECLDGSQAADWDLGDVPAGSQRFSEHAFDDDVACPARLEVRDGDGNLVLERIGEIAGGFGFAL